MKEQWLLIEYNKVITVHDENFRRRMCILVTGSRPDISSLTESFLDVIYLANKFLVTIAIIINPFTTDIFRFIYSEECACFYVSHLSFK